MSILRKNFHRRVRRVRREKNLSHLCVSVFIRGELLVSPLRGLRDLCGKSRHMNCSRMGAEIGNGFVDFTKRLSPQRPQSAQRRGTDTASPSGCSRPR